MSTTVLKPFVIDLPDRGLCAIDYIDYFDEGRYGADNIHFVSRFDDLGAVAEQMDKCLSLQTTSGSLIHFNRLNVPGKWLEPLQNPNEKYPQRAQYAIRFMLRIRFFGDFGYLDIGAKWTDELTEAAAEALSDTDDANFFVIKAEDLKVVNSCWLSHRDAEEILNVLTGKSLNAKNQSLVPTPISYNGDKEYNPESNTSTMMSAEAVEMLNLTYLTDGENVLSDGNGVVKGA